MSRNALVWLSGASVMLSAGADDFERADNCSVRRQTCRVKAGRPRHVQQQQR